MKTKELENKIKIYNEAYRKGEPLVSDQEYDLLLEELKKIDPENEIFKSGVIEEVEGDRMEELPIPMYSLEKIKEVKELKRFVKEVWSLNPNDKIIITPKYDGISLCVDEWEQNVWTRGDGVEGQKSSNHFKCLRNGRISSKSHFNHTFGEVIFNTERFLQVKGEYKSARNCVAGLFNSPTPNEKMLSSVDYIRYGTDREDLDKSQQLAEMSKIYDDTSTYWTITAANFENEDNVILNLLNDIFEQNTSYKCDGLVLEVDKASIRQKLGRLPNNNPKYAIAFKNPDWSERSETKVKDIEWNVSKDGKVKPVILVEPIDLCGATIQRATGYNAGYICENDICTGATIVIARSGDVIPKHLKTLKYDSNELHKTMDEMMICPSCGEALKWDSTITDLVCLNEDCEQKKVALLVYFFTTLGIEEFGEPTIKKIYQAGYDTVYKILNLTPKEIREIDGLGNSIAKTLTDQFVALKKNGISLAKSMTAYNVFKGVIAEKTCQKIFNNLSVEDLERIENLSTIEESHLTSIEGIGEITAKAFNEGMEIYNKLDFDGISISYISEEKIKCAESQMSVCFTGFRNKEWEDRLIKAGHKIASGVTSKTTHLVVKDLSSSSSKKVKANSLQIPIFTKEEFEKFLEEKGI